MRSTNFDEEQHMHTSQADQFVRARIASAEERMKKRREEEAQQRDDQQRLDAKKAG